MQSVPAVLIHMEEILQGIANIGFPIVVAAYLLVRIEVTNTTSLAGPGRGFQLPNKSRGLCPQLLQKEIDAFVVQEF